MTIFQRIAALLIAAAFMGLSACGSGEEATNTDATTGTTADAGTSGEEGEGEDGEDHSDEDGEDHADEDKDHDEDGEGHKDEDGHDEDDEDHKDEDGHDEDDEDHDDEHDDDKDHDDEHDDEHDDHDDEGGLSAHEHGAAELSVAWNEGEMVIDLISPTHNIFGFEYEPTTDEDVALAAERTDALIAPGVIAVNDEAGCELSSDPTTELEFEGSHAEITASWLLDCANPDEIKQIDTAALFAQFPNLEDIDAQWASGSDQSAAELTPSATVLNLE